MPKSSFIPLQCEPSILGEIETNLGGFSLATLDTDWLVSAAYFRSPAGLLVASAAIEVLRDGTVARPLSIATQDAMLANLGNALPDIRHRIEARGFNHALPDRPGHLHPPPMIEWFGKGYATAVLIRRIERYEALHRVACGLLFTQGGTSERLLIGTDVTTPALVASHDPQLIHAYVADCDISEVADYRALLT